MRIPNRLQPYFLALLACLGLLLVEGYETWRECEVAIAQTRADTANLANVLHEYSTQRLRLLQVTMKQAHAVVATSGSNGAESPGRDFQPLQRQLQNVLPRNSLIHGFLLVDAQGQTYLSTVPAAERIDSNLAARPWFLQQQQATRDDLVFGPLEKSVGGTWWWPVSQRLVSAEGRFVGVLVAVVSTDSFQRFFDTVNTGSNGFVTLFLTNGWMLATAPPANDKMFARPWADTPMFKEHLPKASSGTVQQVVVRDGTERVYSYRALADFPVVISVGVSMTDALAGWRAGLWWKSGLLLAVSASLLLSAAALSRHYGRREAAELAAIAAAEHAALAQKKTEKSERFLQTISDNIPLRVAYFDAQRRFVFVNRMYVDLFRRPIEQILGHTPEEITGKLLAPVVQEQTHRTLAGEPTQFQFEDTRGGVKRVMEVNLVPDLALDGKVLGYYAASSDVTERHSQQQQISQALEERETLLREVYHRVKNNLQVIQSLLSLQRRALPEGLARAALDDSVQRIRAMALVHEKLYQTGNLAAVALQEYTPDLLRQIAEASGANARGVRLQCEVTPLEAALDVAVPFGLLVTELVGNSLKHAFPDGRSGEIWVRLLRRGLHLHLTVSDNGMSLPEGFDLAASLSMGLQLATSLAGQLGGELQAHSDQGAVFSSALPRLG